MSHPNGPGEAIHSAIDGLVSASKHRSFWALAIAFAVCGATTNGLVGIHFIPSARDHGNPAATAAGFLAAVGVLDIVGTVASGWLTDWFDPRILLAVYYTFRGVSLLLLPWLLSDTVHVSMIVFIVIDGLDWVATVPPTAALCSSIFGDKSMIVFGWVFAAHQIGAAIAALGAGVIRDVFGEYTYAWWGGAAICVLAAVLSITVTRARATLVTFASIPHDSCLTMTSLSKLRATGVTSSRDSLQQELGMMTSSPSVSPSASEQ